MAKISDFVQVRSDGRVVPSGMTVQDMLNEGWRPAKVVALKWRSAELDVQFSAALGVHGIVVQGNEFVAAIASEDETGSKARLIVLAADGSEKGRVSNRLTVSGTSLDGSFSWFEPAVSSGVNRFGAVFQSDDTRMFLCEIDASECRILTATPTQ